MQQLSLGEGLNKETTNRMSFDVLKRMFWYGTIKCFCIASLSQRKEVKQSKKRREQENKVDEVPASRGRSSEEQPAVDRRGHETRYGKHPRSKDLKRYGKRCALVPKSIENT